LISQTLFLVQLWGIRDNAAPNMASIDESGGIFPFWSRRLNFNEKLIVKSE
jgi:hypothetical protein